jgi:hypothetical protein
MKTLVFFVLIALLAVLVVRSILRAREVAAKITASPDPVRVALMQREALAIALQNVETLDEPPESIAQRRKALLEKQRNLPDLAYG